MLTFAEVVKVWIKCRNALSSSEEPDRWRSGGIVFAANDIEPAETTSALYPFS